MTSQTNPAKADKQISALNTLLRGELSAVETYDQAIKQLAKDPQRELTENRDCHAKRVPVLRNQITALGGKPDASSGIWGSWAKLVEQGASVLGKKTIIATLEEGEDRGIADYKRLQNDLETSARQVVDTDLFPAQKRTHERMRNLKNRG